MPEPGAERGPDPRPWHLVAAFAPIVLALLALAGLLLFHCARIGPPDTEVGGSNREETHGGTAMVCG